MDLSKRRVDRAGHVLRASAQGLDVGRDVLADALDVADEFRASHEGALDQARDDLLGLSRHVSAREFSDRLKRVDTISGKLAREPSLKLSRMRDIAGCRLVVATLATLEDVTARIVHGCNGELVRAIDYVDKPRPTGYRGIHLILRYEGRLAEIQLRTQLMHKVRNSLRVFNRSRSERVLLVRGIPRPRGSVIWAKSWLLRIEVRQFRRICSPELRVLLWILFKP